MWGLCDGASAALLYGHQDARVSGLVLVNPWARTEEGEAKARLKHYYQARLLEGGLWKKIIRGEFDYGDAARSLLANVARAAGSTGGTDAPFATPLPDRLYQGLEQFKGNVLLILSENDLTAQEFGDVISSTPRWRRLVNETRVRHLRLAGADHTFARREWREQVINSTGDWLDNPAPVSSMAGTR